MGKTGTSLAAGATRATKDPCSPFHDASKNNDSLDMPFDSGDDTGPVYGIGFAYELDSGVTFGAEVLRQEFDGLAGPATETDTTTITVRGGIRF